MDKTNSLKIRDLAAIRVELAQLGINNKKTVITHCQTHHRSGFTYLIGRILGFNIKAYVAHGVNGAIGLIHLLLSNPHFFILRQTLV